MAELLTDWRDVEGWLTEDEGRALAALAAGRDALEIGSYKGRSTVCMAGPARSVVAVDWHRGDPAVGHVDTLAEFLANLERHGVRHKVTPVVGRVESVGPWLAPGSFGLAFIDDDHDVSVYTSTAVALAAVRPGGVIAWHDSHMPAVAEAIREAAAGRAVSRAGSLAWVQF